ncbi:MAG: adenosine-specific kinase [Spirochaetales bacterium]|nr:adenosine-specific kinase [Spirochaetales bacterium]
MEITLKAHQLIWPEDCNIIVGQSHFIKTVEDISEILFTSVPDIKFGLAFCEASGPCLIRTGGNSDDLVEAAALCAETVGAGHSFFLILRKAYPINVLNQIKQCQEVARIFAATANPLQVITAETDQGRGIVGVIDGFSPKGRETDQDRKDRFSLLRTIGYKIS